MKAVKITNLEKIKSSSLKYNTVYTLNYKDLIFSLEKVKSKLQGDNYKIKNISQKSIISFSALWELKDYIKKEANNYKRKELEKKQEKNLLKLIPDAAEWVDYKIIWDKDKTPSDLLELSSNIVKRLNKKIFNITDIHARKEKKIYTSNNIIYVIAITNKITKEKINTLYNRIIKDITYSDSINRPKLIKIEKKILIKKKDNIMNYLVIDFSYHI